MKDRLLQLLDLEQISPSKFADIIGVQRSSVSHVISGRNKPSYDFLYKTLKAFPGLNASWLMMGEGTMYEQMGRKVPGNLFNPPDSGSEAENHGDIEEQDPEIPEISPSDAAVESSESAASDSESTTGAAIEGTSATTATEQGAIAVHSGKIVQVMVIYDDDTFRTFAPAN